jgi:hypothetical protein
MAVHLEKITKKIMDKVFKKPEPKPQKPVVVKPKPEVITPVRTRPQIPQPEPEMKPIIKHEYIEPTPSLSINDKFLLSERVKKLSNDGLASVNLN